MELLTQRARAVRAADPGDTEDVLSPCVSVCRVNAVTGWCEGCFRTLDEISAWQRLDTLTRRKVWRIIERRAGIEWQAGIKPRAGTGGRDA